VKLLVVLKEWLKKYLENQALIRLLCEEVDSFKELSLVAADIRYEAITLEHVSVSKTISRCNRVARALAKAAQAKEDLEIWIPFLQTLVLFDITS
jgi:hypothetical protein